MSRQELVDKMKQEADAKGFDVVYSPVNRAWLIISQSPGDLNKAELYGVMNTIEEVRDWIKEADGNVPSKGPMARAAERRNSAYNQMSPREQWAEDKRLGILDWDGDPSK